MKNNYISQLHFILKHSFALLILGILLFGTGSVSGQISTLSPWSSTHHGIGNLSATYAIPAGSNARRLLVIAIASSRTAIGARTATVTYGGQPLTQGPGDMSTTSTRQHTQLYYLDEAGLSAATGSTLSVTFGGGTACVNDVFVTIFDNVNQSTPIADTQNYNSISTGVDPIVFATGLVVNASEQAVEIISSFRSGNNTPRTISAYAANWTRGTTEQFLRTTNGGVRNAVANRSIPATNVIDVSSTNMSGSSYASMTAMSIKEAPKYFRSITTGNWSTLTTWQQSYDNVTWVAATSVPTSGDNLVTIQNSHTVTLTANATASSLTINGGGNLDVNTYTLTGTGTIAIASGATLLVGGASNFPTGFTITTLSTGSTVNYDRGGAQTIANQTYSNLTLSGSGTKTLQSATTAIGGNLTLSGTVTATAVVGLTIGGSMTIGTNTTFDGGSFTHNLEGNFTNNGSFTANTCSVVLNGNATQLISGTSSATFYDLKIQNVGTANNNIITLNQSVIVANSLSLITGIVVTNATNTLTINNTANWGITGGAASSYINGPLNWHIGTSGSVNNTNYLFPIGKSTYLPFSIAGFSPGYSSTTLQVEAFESATGSNTSGISQTEYWRLNYNSYDADIIKGSIVSLGKKDPISPYDIISYSTTKAGAYTSLGGITATYGVTSSNPITQIGMPNYPIKEDYFVLSKSTTPKIITSTSSVSGTYIVNFGPSAEQKIFISGTNLGADITVNPTAHFEISKTPGVNYQSSPFTLPLSGNNVNSTPIYVRLKANFTAAAYPTEYITITSGNVIRSIGCNGIVYEAAPTVTAGGGRDCNTNSTINLYSTPSNSINILYWAGPNNYYSDQKDPIITGTTSTADGVYTVTGSMPTSGNLISNGDFESENIDFYSSYDYKADINGINIRNEIIDPATYSITPNPFWVHYNFKNCWDNTKKDETGHQMVLNGANKANVSIWSQTVNVTPNTDYQFVYYLQTVSSQSPSVLQLFANNSPLGTPNTAISTQGVFSKFYYNWNSGSNTTATLDLRNQNAAESGNDFAIDDISFTSVTQVSSSVTIGSTSGEVAVSIITSPSTTVPTGTSVTFTATSTNGGSSPKYAWTVTSSGGIITSHPSTTSSIFSYTPADGDIVTCELTSDISCVTKKTATASITMTVTTTGANYWIGALGPGGTVWSDPNNWTAGKVPAPGDNVEFANAENNIAKGGAAKNDLYVDNNRIVGNLINIASGQNLIIPANTQLYVNNKITLTPVNPNAPYDQIVIKADPTLPNGSLIFHNPQNDKIYGSVEMYTQSYKNKNPRNEDDEYFWQYFGIPVESIKADPTFNGAYVRKANEAGDETDENYYWTELGSDSTLNAFDGYEICQPLDSKYLLFQGQLVNRDFSRTLIYSSGVGVKYPGQHLLANPYAAAINVNQMNFGPDIDASVSLYKTGSYGQWSEGGNGVADGSEAGQFTTIPKSVAGINGLGEEVPSMSSMLVRVPATRTDANSVLSFNYNDVITKNTTLQKVKAVDGLTNTDLISTRIDLTGQHYSDRMWIFTEPTCTRNFDNGWDGRKMLGSALAPQIYAVEADGDYQVNSVSDMHDTDLAFQAGDEVEYTLKFTHENIQRQYAGVYLVDLIENKTVDVTLSGSTYTFATAQSNVPTKRFKILTRPYEKGASDIEAQVKIFTAPGRVFVHNLSTFKGDCTLYDIAGRAIKNAPFAANAVTEVLNNLTPGAYVVNTIADGETVSKRVIVQ